MHHETCKWWFPRKPAISWEKKNLVLAIAPQTFCYLPFGISATVKLSMPMLCYLCVAPFPFA